MKKFILSAIIIGSVAMLTACSSNNYKKEQTKAEMHQPINCKGLHLKNALWSFVDDFGQQVDVVGTCKKGMKHGNFTFYVAGKQVAFTKFVRDNEEKTKCTATQEKTRLPLERCMQQYAELNAKHAEQ